LLDAIKRFVAELTDGATGAGLGEHELRLATAALLIHAATIDGSLSEVERHRLQDLLKQRFALDDAAAAELIEQAIVADEKAVDLYRFTRVLNERLDENERLRMVEMLWAVAYADGAASDYENNLIWRVADLLGVSGAERIALRQRVAAASGRA
jgi:uncharacterized tellurite resistance protein B-like protein